MGKEENQREYNQARDDLYKAETAEEKHDAQSRVDNHYADSFREAYDKPNDLWPGE